ncbi:hypothetical protein H2204_002440 [Knufia peltigerae]|uniref:Amine oxidase n=1 Tax=Knufia peltigerae TaxID=1002370 RepID=A0AA38YBI8_9EURO|nr:hypothetical protein H2204_002440 [Knufia peltigerae]
MQTSREGVHWTPRTGVVQGLPSLSVIEPQQFHVPGAEELLDVIVIGAGYAGLVASRELAIQQKKVLLLEGRDRIGGRTWHSTINGFNYEMGGTWIHWHMPHIYHEMSRYGLQDDWIVSQTPGGEQDFFTLTSYGQQSNMSHERENEMFTKTWATFCNVDGVLLRDAMTYPLSAELTTKYDHLSCQDRINQIRDQLTQQEIGFLEGVLLQMGGGPLDRMGLTDALRWYALGGFTPTGLNDIALSTRPKSGQSTIARKIFDHAVRSGLKYSFSTPVAKIEDGSYVTVTTRSGQTFMSKKLICTIPLNVLGDITFSPPLSPLKRAAISQGSTQKCNKIHFDLAGPDMKSWSSLGSPGKGLISALADNTTPANDTHVVTFGPSADSKQGMKLKNNIEGIKDALNHLLPFKRDIKRIVYHDWFNDEFSKGTWCYLPPDWVSRYLKAMQQPEGNVILANADWSNGWRGWIDGAAQQGIESASKVVDALQSVPKSSRL